MVVAGGLFVKQELTPNQWYPVCTNKKITFFMFRNIEHRLLRTKLYDLESQRAHDEEAEARRSQIGTGDRSEKIRTYNFPQGRVTDHRIKLTLYKIDSIMNGDLQEILDALMAADQAAKLADMNGHQ